MNEGTVTTVRKLNTSTIFGATILIFMIIIFHIQHVLDVYMVQPVQDGFMEMTTMESNYTNPNPIY